MKHQNGRIAGSLLYNLGITYFDYGSVKVGRKTIGHYFKIDKINENQLNDLTHLCNNVKVLYSSLRYAPEIKNPMILFKTKAQIKREQTK